MTVWPPGAKCALCVCLGPAVCAALAAARRLLVVGSPPAFAAAHVWPLTSQHGSFEALARRWPERRRQILGRGVR